MGLTDTRIYCSHVMDNGACSLSVNRIWGIFSLLMAAEAELKSLCPSPHRKSLNYTQKRALVWNKSVACI